MINSAGMFETLVEDANDMIIKEFVKKNGYLTESERRHIEIMIERLKTLLDIESANRTFNEWKEILGEA